MPRSKALATADDLAAALGPLFVDKGSSFLKYDDCKEVAKAKTDPALIKKYACVAAAIQPHGFVQKRKTIEDALTLMLEQHRYKTKLSDSDANEWHGVMTNRLMNFCSSIQSSIMKKPPPKWLEDCAWFTKDGIASAGETTPTPKKTTPAKLPVASKVSVDLLTGLFCERLCQKLHGSLWGPWSFWQSLSCNTITP